MVRVLSLNIIDCTLNIRCNSLLLQYFTSSLSHGRTAGWS